MPKYARRSTGALLVLLLAMTSTGSVASYVSAQGPKPSHPKPPKPPAHPHPHGTNPKPSHPVDKPSPWRPPVKEHPILIEPEDRPSTSEGSVTRLPPTRPGIGGALSDPNWRPKVDDSKPSESGNTEALHLDEPKGSLVGRFAAKVTSAWNRLWGRDKPDQAREEVKPHEPPHGHMPSSHCKDHPLECEHPTERVTVPAR
jgi:hypothetical protein